MGKLDVIAVIQAHHTDLLPGETNPSHYCLEALRKSRRVERIVIAAADLPENRVFGALAARWGVDVFFGSELDVVERLVAAAAAVGAGEDTVIARVLLNRFYLDIDLVDGCIALLRETQSDFVMLPYDFDITFGADVLTLGCLRRADRLLAGPDVEHLRFRPWLFIEDHPEDFRVTTCEGVPSYPRARLDEIRHSGRFAERDCGTCSTFTYRLIAEALGPDDIVLDIACGTGEGTVILAGRCRRVYGCDLSGGVVQEAREAHRAANLTFDVEDGCAMTYPDGLFSVIVSSNTLEHVEDDRLLLDNFRRVLQQGGRLILETPLLRRRPFNFPLLSSHVREYEKEPLLALMRDAGFDPERTFGMNRGIYVDWERAREAVLIYARKR